MPKKWGDAYPLSYELQIETMSSKCELWTPNVNHELQIETMSSNSQSWAPILNLELHLSYSKIYKNLQIA